ncbi:MAG: hypothetical protein F6K50_06555 [Moorea sp. SIO3I7]|uniref:hypothetical protein n=1 Tax=unclassified Moorena TaxID=2683338 RepID=UPI0013BF7D39|nr:MULTISPECIES: hypothetical protein [unclassified Moorena]NEN95201.1 hypothetical protein [Moorena sp. SIO3I7]NEO05470.1 hypothetical protein [Moorena sp. SIO3I8]NEO22832.1 hypothetical protein [Moorena sp. SIO4A5]NEQ60721.1 hypothetical protein [Moorena sp. SIO4A1]
MVYSQSDFGRNGQVVGEGIGNRESGIGNRELAIGLARMRFEIDIGNYWSVEFGNTMTPIAITQ